MPQTPSLSAFDLWDRSFMGTLPCHIIKDGLYYKFLRGEERWWVNLPCGGIKSWRNGDPPPVPIHPGILSKAWCEARVFLLTDQMLLEVENPYCQYTRPGNYFLV